jgi:hypothetical protein
MPDEPFRRASSSGVMDALCDPTDPLSFMRRAQLVKLDVDRLSAEARTASPERVKAIQAEIEVRVDALRQIRAEQLIADANGYRSPEQPKRRRWWRRAK